MGRMSFSLKYLIKYKYSSRFSAIKSATDVIKLICLMSCTTQLVRSEVKDNRVRMSSGS